MRKKILGYAVGPIGSAVLGFITIPLISWHFQVEDIGRIAMLQVAASLVVLAYSLGLDQAYVREYYGNKNTSSLFAHSLLPGLFLLIFTLIMVFAYDLTLLSNWLFSSSSILLSSVVAIYFIASYIARFLSLILRMEERALAYSMSQLLPKILYVTFILIVVLLEFPTNIQALVTANTLSVVAILLVFLFFTKHVWGKIFSIRLNRPQLAAVTAYGFPLMVGGMAYWGLDAMDKLFLRSMSSLEQLGVYAVSASVAGVAAVFTSVFNTIWAPLVYRWHNENVDESKVDKISENVLAAIYFFVTLAGLFSWLLRFILPPQYIEVERIIILCLLGPLLYALSETTVVGIALSKKTTYSMLATFIAMLSNLVGNYILVPSYAAMGAALSTAISFFIFYICRTEFSCAVWRPLPRLKSYLMVFILILSSVINGFFIKELSQTIIVWGCVFVFGVVVFKKQIILTESMLRGFIGGYSKS